MNIILSHDRIREDQALTFPSFETRQKGRKTTTETFSAFTKTKSLFIITCKGERKKEVGTKKKKRHVRFFPKREFRVPSRAAPRDRIKSFDGST